MTSPGMTPVELLLIAIAAAAAVMAGGAIGGRIASRMKPAVLRWIVVTVGIALAIYYWSR